MTTEDPTEKKRRTMAFFATLIRLLVVILSLIGTVWHLPTDLHCDQ